MQVSLSVLVFQSFSLQKVYMKILGSFTFVSEFSVITRVELVIVAKHTFIQLF